MASATSISICSTKIAIRRCRSDQVAARCCRKRNFPSARFRHRWRGNRRQAINGPVVRRSPRSRGPIAALGLAATIEGYARAGSDLGGGHGASLFASRQSKSPMSGHSQFSLLTERRFLPFFLTQSLGAFNDNVFKQGFVALVVFVGSIKVGISNAHFSLLAGCLFILPFFLFSALGGQLADKYDKARLARWIKALEVMLMLGAALGLVTQSAPILLAVVFLIGLQSTLFGPLKYGILPQVLRDEELTGGNGLVESATMVSILLGTLAGTAMVAIPEVGLVLTAAVVGGVAIIGWVAALAMPPVPPVAPDLKINFNPFTETWRSLKFLAGNRIVFLSCLGISWFWFFASMYFLILPVYVADVIGGGSSVYALLLAIFSVGTGLGALLCEVLSRRKVEIGLVPFGSIGMTLFGLDIYFALPAASGLAGLDVAQFFAQPFAWRLAIDLTLMAVFSGFFIVPLFALIQQRSDPAFRSRVIGANNMMNAAFMASSSSYCAGCKKRTCINDTLPVLDLNLRL